MEIKKSMNGTELELFISGRIDTTTAPELEKEIKDNIDNITKLVLDVKDMVYISSAGLRVLLSAHKKMNSKDGMIIRNASEVVVEVFDVTGFNKVFKVE